MKKIYEARDVKVYKKLLRVLGDYSIRAPATGVDKLFDTVVEYGMKIMPKDKKALAILNYILSNPIPIAIQKLLNMRFSDLPKVEFRPIYRVGNKHQVAWWNNNNQVFDKIQSLIDFKGIGKTGQWTDINGENVTLIDLSKEKK